MDRGGGALAVVIDDERGEDELMGLGIGVGGWVGDGVGVQMGCGGEVGDGEWRGVVC